MSNNPRQTTGFADGKWGGVIGSPLVSMNKITLGIMLKAEQRGTPSFEPRKSGKTNWLLCDGGHFQRYRRLGHLGLIISERLRSL